MWFSTQFTLIYVLVLNILRKNPASPTLKAANHRGITDHVVAN